MSQIRSDKRTKDDLMECMKKVAKEYTPEWRLDEEYPDMGTALTHIYADMFLRSIKQFNQIPMKNQMAFCNQLQMKRLPARTSGGCVTLHLVNEEVGGVLVPRGAGILGEGEDGREVRLETLDDVSVTPSVIRHMFYVSDHNDEIRHVYDVDGGFQENAPNLQTHEWYVSHKEALHIETAAWIELTFGSPIGEEAREKFLDSTYAEFSYGTMDGFHPFESVSVKKDGILFYKGRRQKGLGKVTVNGKENYWIRCRIHRIEPFLTFGFRKMAIGVRSKEIMPEIIYGAGAECLPKEYLPFGERFSRLAEVYFASGEALSKKGAIICLDFQLKFMRIPIRDYVKEEIEYKWIMKRGDVKKEKEYEITIREVCWEYYNGKGWRRLFPDGSHQDAFCFHGGETKCMKTISFPCPNDISMVLVDSCESFYIRARIMKVENEFEYNGHYMTPIASHTTFRYHYPEGGVVPDEIMTRNNMEWEEKKENVKPFYQTGVDRSAWYLGFSSLFPNGPIRILLTTREQSRRERIELVWEYGGSDSFQEMNVLDETGNLTRNGLLTFMGGMGGRKRRLFGKELYWIRILEQTGWRARNSWGWRMFLTGMYLNSVKVEATGKRRTEWFVVNQKVENKTLSLSEDSILDMEVWVDEANEPGGDLKKWGEVEDFDQSGPSDRHYVADRIRGEIQFGNGRHGRMLPASGKENVKVTYRVGGGEATNLEAGSKLKLERSYGFIHAVTNVEPIAGGKDAETVEESMKRGKATLKHRHRAVTMRDYEDLAREASPGILHVRCFGNRDGKGEKRAGYVTLVVVSRDVKRDLAYLPVYFEDKVEEGLLAGGRFQIIEPHYVECGVGVELVVKEMDSVFTVKKDVEKRLGEYMESLRIGEAPNRMRVKTILQGVSNVSLVKKVEFLNDIIKGDPYIFVRIGLHDIFVNVEP